MAQGSGATGPRAPARVLALLGGLIVLLHGADAGEILPGPVAAEIVAVIDGDTIAVRARVWLGQDVEIRVRLAGIDAPEIRGRCARERLLAGRARDFVAARTAGGRVTLSDIQYGKYAGRIVARVTTAGGQDLARALLRAGLARTYGGGGRLSWCGRAERPHTTGAPARL